MQKLLEGIRRYHDEIFPTKREQLERLMREGQKPEILAVACSDSRIKLGDLTQSGPGELFVVRNAGNIVPPWGEMPSGVSASIEYAVNVLPIRDIIVAGHTGCGAMHAVLEPQAIREMPQVMGWLKFAREAHCTGSLMETTRKNVLLQLQHLRTYPCVKEREDAGKLGIHGWVLMMETGDVDEYNEAEQRWERIT
jgi:carbonic anhydrase